MAEELTDAPWASGLPDAPWAASPKPPGRGLVGAVKEIWEHPPEGPSLVGMAKQLWSGATAPGDIVTGQEAAKIKPEVPGQLSEMDVERENQQQQALQERAGQMATLVAPGALARPGAANIARNRALGIEKPPKMFW